MEELSEMVTPLSSEYHRNAEFINSSYSTTSFNSTEMYPIKMSSYSNQHQPQPTMIYNNNCINSVSSHPSNNLHSPCAPPAPREWAIPQKNNLASAAPEFTLNSNNNSLNGIHPSYMDQRLQPLPPKAEHQVFHFIFRLSSYCIIYLHFIFRVTLAGNFRFVFLLSRRE